MSVVYFDGEEIPERYTGRIWDPNPPLGTRGFNFCSEERIFQLRGTQRDKDAGLYKTYKERCGIETYFIVVDSPIRFLIGDSARGRDREEYCRKCHCNVRGGVQLTKDDPRYEEVIHILMSYILTENDIDFYR